MKYKTIALGGTFDHFHLGHQKFLQEAASFAQHMIVGVTRPELLKNKQLADLIEPLKIRKQSVDNFCRQQGMSYTLLELEDIFGPTITDLSIEALCVTEDTTTGAEKINLERRKLGFSTLHVEKVILSKDKAGEIISSERIRAGLISRTGTVYTDLFKSTLYLTQIQRSFFTRPQGEIVDTPQPGDKLRIAVGDTTLENFVDNNWHYDLGIFDYLKRRKTYTGSSIHSLSVDTKLNNPAQTITPELVEVLKQLDNKKIRHILIEGEEDLAAVAAVLTAPLETSIYYGQPDVGMVRMVVTEEKKETVYQVLAS